MSGDTLVDELVSLVRLSSFCLKARVKYVLLTSFLKSSSSSAALSKRSNFHLHLRHMCSGRQSLAVADPGVVRWVRTNPPLA